MAAEVVAGELGLDLYVIDLSTVVDKYIGETEKNLDRIFAEADRRQRRAALRRGRRALRQALRGQGRARPLRQRRGRLPAAADGAVRRLAILTTNLRANIDEAFTRRLDAIVDFPLPEEDDRLRALGAQPAGRRCRAPATSTSTFLARAFELSGGNIRNVCVSAAFLAADAEAGRSAMARPDPRRRERSTGSSAGSCARGGVRAVSRAGVR